MYDTLRNIFDTLQNEINITFNLKDKLLKSYDRFDDNTLNVIINGVFPLKIINNYLVNCILLNKTEECYTYFFDSDLTEYVCELVKKLDAFKCEIPKNITCKDMFLLLFLPLIKNLKAVHCDLIKRSVDSEAPIKKKNINVGLLETLSVYFSGISLLYGLRFLNTDKKIIFYVQQYYSKKFLSGDYYCNLILDKIKQYDLTDHDLVISYRFFSPEYLDTIEEYVVPNTVLEKYNLLTKYFKSVTVTHIDNVVADVSSLDVRIDDSADLFEYRQESNYCFMS